MYKSIYERSNTSGTDESYNYMGVGFYFVFL